jgi:hypothetical protein
MSGPYFTMLQALTNGEKKIGKQGKFEEGKLTTFQEIF